jgi:hypothetical protein
VSKSFVLQGQVVNPPLELTNSTIFGIRITTPGRNYGKRLIIFTREDLAKMVAQSVKLRNHVLVVGSYATRNNKLCVSAEFVGLDVSIGINVQMDPDEILDVGRSVYNPFEDK